MLQRFVFVSFIAAWLSLGAAADEPGEALRTAASRGDAESVRSLLAQGVDPNAANPYGATALSFAADKGHLGVVRLLVEGGADVNAKDSFYRSPPVEWASYNGHVDVVAYLIEHGAEAADALRMAIYREKAEVAAAVLEAGKLSAEELSEALSAARQAEVAEIVALLEKAGAKPPPPSDFVLAPEALARYAGTYLLPAQQGVESTLAVEEGSLVVHFPENPPLPLEPTDATTFRPRGGTFFTLRFELDGERVTGFKMHQEGRDEPFEFVRKPAEGTETASAETAESAETTESAETKKAAPVVADAKVDIPRGAARRDWPAFRGPNAAGTADGRPPVTWNAPEGENVRFKTAIPGRAHSSPIVWGDRLFVSTAVASVEEKPFRPGLYGDVDVAESDAEYSWRLYSLDKKSGEILWQRVAHTGRPTSQHHFKATQANSTPVTDGTRIVVLMGSEGLYSYDLDGNLLWKRDLGPLDVGWFYDPSYEWGHSSSPVIYKDLVIVQADLNRDPFIAAFALDDGREVWRTPRENLPSWGTPTLLEGEDRVELVTNGSKRIRAYDPSTGKEWWSLAPTSEVTVGTPVVGHGLVFVTGHYTPISPIYAIRPGGNGDISLPEGAESSARIAWKNDRGGTYIPTPIVYGEHLYTNAMSGVLTCYRAATGQRLYRERIAGRGGVAFTASPVAAAGRLYLSSEQGDVYVVRAGPRFELLATNPMGEVLMATPAISEDMIYVRSLEHVFGIGEPPSE